MGIRVPVQIDINTWILEWFTCEDPMELRFFAKHCGRYGKLEIIFENKLVDPEHVDAGCFSDGTTCWGCVIQNQYEVIPLLACREEDISSDPLMAEPLGVLQLAISRQLKKLMNLLEELAKVVGSKTWLGCPSIWSYIL
ncbi:hypothetical protein L195_g014526 [Trifolium pratense]|uniref:Uncharacterized protein n=1 Tax=Trifolium pratense TaxID=57577 RepID=A0A2K3PR74_TRIPR|nr:hypothetical protein L195_g014526 [Trifolium pratense]